MHLNCENTNSLKEYKMSEWVYGEVNLHVFFNLFFILSCCREIFTLTKKTKAMFTLLLCEQLLTGLIQIASIGSDLEICRKRG